MLIEPTESESLQEIDRYVLKAVLLAFDSDPFFHKIL